MFESRLAGVDVIVQPPVKSTRQVKRTWKERLFSLSPFTKYKDEEHLCEVLEDNQVIKVEGKLIMNAATFERFNKEIYPSK